MKRVQTALTASSFWEKLKTDWVCLDTELMPWSAKAQALIQQQFAAVGAAATAALPDVLSVLRQAQARGIAVEEIHFGTGKEPALRGGVPAVLLAGGFAGRLPAGPFSHSGY